MAVHIDSWGTDRLSMRDRLAVIEQIRDGLPAQVEPRDAPDRHLAELASRRSRAANSPGVGKPWRDAPSDSAGLTLVRTTAMGSLSRALLSAVALSAALTAAPAGAVSPNNPYRTFNLSGINYGSMQWERAQREGRRVWPYYNAPSRTVGTRSGAWVGAVVGGGAGAGTIVEAGGSRSTPRSNPRILRRWRR